MHSRYLQGSVYVFFFFLFFVATRKTGTKQSQRFMREGGKEQARLDMLWLLYRNGCTWWPA